MKIGHIVYRYKPLIGGAEIYVASLFQMLKDYGFSQNVYQIDNGMYDPEIKPVKPLFKYFPKLISFNLGLLKDIPSLNAEDILLINYPEHFLPVFWHKKTIVISHGASWTHETNRIRRYLRKASAKISFKLAKIMISNDTFFYREMGLSILPKHGMFQEIADGKWFIPNCVDTQVFKRVKPDTRIADLNAIIVPRNLTFARGIDIAIKAFAIFNKRFPETKLVLNGNAIADNKASIVYKSQLEDLINDLGLKEKVLHIGQVPWDRMPSLYSSAAITLVPTRYSEGTSFSALESMACGTATLSTAIEGLLDLPTEKCKVDVEDMADNMSRVYFDRKKIGYNQQNIVRSTYNITNWKQAWLKVINET